MSVRLAILGSTGSIGRQALDVAARRRDRVEVRSLAAGRDLDALEGKCGECRFGAICGGCRARAYAATGCFLAEEPFCTYRPDLDRRAGGLQEARHETHVH